eukprot:6212808-Pleurochrysis_carterae.AAC.1
MSTKDSLCPIGCAVRLCGSVVQRSGLDGNGKGALRRVGAYCDNDADEAIVVELCEEAVSENLTGDKCISWSVWVTLVSKRRVVP